MKKNHAVLSYALLMLGLVSQPADAKAAELPAVLPKEDAGACLVFTEEPEETIRIDHGSYEQILIDYEASPVDSDDTLDVLPCIEICGDAVVSEVQVICGNVRILTDAPVDTLILGEVVQETASDWSDSDVLQQVEIGTDIGSVQVLSEADSSYYRSYTYKPYTGSCTLRAGCQIKEVSIYEVYSDVFSGEEVPLMKKHGSFPEESRDHASDMELFCDGIWNEKMFPCEEISDWLLRYESRYELEWYARSDASGIFRWEKRAFLNGRLCGSVLLDASFDAGEIPYSDPIFLDCNASFVRPDTASVCPLRLSGGRRQVTVYSGTVILDGDVDELIIANRYDASFGKAAAQVTVNGNVSSLILHGDCASVTLSVTGSVTLGCQTAGLCNDPTMKMLYFSKEMDGVSSILYNGTFSPDLYFYPDSDCTGAGFRMDGVLSENRRAAGMDGVSDPDSYHREAYLNLGYLPHVLTTDPVLPASFDGNVLSPAGFAFALTLYQYEKTEDDLLLFLPGSTSVIPETAAPLTFCLRLPDALASGLTPSNADTSDPTNSIERTKMLCLVRIAEDAVSGERSYELLDCTLDGTELSFSAKRFSTFALVWMMPSAEVVADEPDCIPEEPDMSEPEEKPDTIPEEPHMPEPEEKPKTYPEKPDLTEPEEKPKTIPEEPNEPENIPGMPAEDCPVIPEVPVILNSLKPAAPANAPDNPVIPQLEDTSNMPHMVHAPSTGDNVLASCGLFFFPFVILFVLLGIPGVCIANGTFLLIPDTSHTALTLYEFHAGFDGITMEEYWSFDLLPAYENPSLQAWDDHLIVFYQDDRKRLPQVYVEMDSDEDWIDLACPARGRNARMEIHQDQIYVYTAKEVYICDASDPLAGWKCMERTL